MEQPVTKIDHTMKGWTVNIKENLQIHLYKLLNKLIDKQKYKGNNCLFK